MRIDVAISVDLLSNIDFIDAVNIEYTDFLSTMIILQYKIILTLYWQFGSLNNTYVYNSKFSDLNNFLDIDARHLIQETQEIVRCNSYEQIIFLRNFKKLRRIIDNKSSALGYAMAFGKIIFLSSYKKLKTDKNVRQFLLVRKEIKKFFLTLIKNPQSIVSMDECDLLKINTNLAAKLCNDMKITVIPVNLLLNKDVSLDIAEKYGRVIF